MCVQGVMVEVGGGDGLTPMKALSTVRVSGFAARSKWRVFANIFSLLFVVLFHIVRVVRKDSLMF